MGYVYILTNKDNSVLYIGVTNDIERRVMKHQQSINTGYTHRYNVKKLIYYEVMPDMESAIKREKVLKKWERKWKEELINEVNPNWDSLVQGDSVLPLEGDPRSSRG